MKVNFAGLQSASAPHVLSCGKFLCLIFAAMPTSDLHIPNPEKKHLAILGSTGSIGTQALDVVAAHPEEFVVEVLAAGNNCDLLIQQALKFRPNVVVINELAHLAKVKDALLDEGIKVYGGEEALA